jgi:MYXO-CTERM domain-containing protein
MSNLAGLVTYAGDPYYDTSLTLTLAESINDSGQILAYGYVQGPNLPNGVQFGQYLLTPADDSAVPEPGAAEQTSLGLGALAAILARRRRSID